MRIQTILILAAIFTLAQGQVEESTDLGELTLSAESDAVVAASADLLAAAGKSVSLTNKFRKEQSLSGLKMDIALKEAANDFARYIAKTDRYEHHADGQRPSTRAENHGYEFCFVSENIATVFSSADLSATALAEKFVQGWKDSEICWLLTLSILRLELLKAVRPGTTTLSSSSADRDR